MPFSDSFRKASIKQGILTAECRKNAPLAALLRTFRWGYLHPGTHLTGQIAAMIHHSNLYMDVNL